MPNKSSTIKPKKPFAAVQPVKPIPSVKVIKQLKPCAEKW